MLTQINIPNINLKTKKLILNENEESNINEEVISKSIQINLLNNFKHANFEQSEKVKCDPIQKIENIKSYNTLELENELDIFTITQQSNNFNNATKISLLNKLFKLKENEKKAVFEKDLEIVFDYLFVPKMTLQIIGDKNNLSRERIRQIISRFFDKYQIIDSVISNNFENSHKVYETFSLINHLTKNFFLKIVESEIYRKLPRWRPQKSELKNLLISKTYGELKNLDLLNLILENVTLDDILINLEEIKLDNNKYKILVIAMIKENKIITKDDVEWLKDEFGFNSVRALNTNLERFSLSEGYNLLKSNSSEYVYFEKNKNVQILINEIIIEFMNWEKGIYNAKIILEKFKDKFLSIGVKNAIMVDQVFELFNENPNWQFLSYQRAPYIQNANFGKIESNSTSNEDFFIELIINHGFNTSNKLKHYLITKFGWQNETILGSKIFKEAEEIINQNNNSKK